LAVRRRGAKIGTLATVEVSDKLIGPMGPWVAASQKKLKRTARLISKFEIGIQQCQAVKVVKV
jgi:hypothetical protein